MEAPTSIYDVWLRAYLVALAKGGRSDLAEVQADRCALEFKRRFPHVFSTLEDFR